MFGRRHHQVIVIGAGPSGLLTALTLKQRGIDVAILDKHRRTGVHSYALALHPRSLQLLDDVGLAQGLIERGHRLDHVSFYDGAGKRAQVDLSQLGGPFPFVLVLAQRDLEGALEQRLRDEKVRVQWNHRVEALHFDGPLTRLDVAVLDQVPSGYPVARLEWEIVRVLHYDSPYVVGADGYHSFMRKLLKIDYHKVRGESTYSVFEFDAPMKLGDEVRVILDDRGTGVLWPLHDDRCRFSFSVDTTEQHRPTLDQLNRLIEARAPWFSKAAGDIRWSTRVQFDHRLASSFGSDRTWLVGDSAHLSSPVGVHSMNGGLIEAVELGKRLAETIEDNGSGELLETYGAQRMAEWRLLLNVGGALRARSTVDPWIERWSEQILSSIPATGDDLRQLLGQLDLELNQGRSDA